MKIYWHIITTIIFYTIGIFNEVFISTEKVGSFENYFGYIFLALAVVDTVTIIKDKLKLNK